VGRTEKNILDKENTSVIVNLLKKAYCDEMQIFHYFWYIGINIEGIGLVTYAPTLKIQATAELTHAELLSNRISELGEKSELRVILLSGKHKVILVHWTLLNI
jgi:ferritin-like protein